MKHLTMGGIFALAAAGPVLASNTIIRIGLAPEDPNRVVNGVTTNTTHIDRVLNSVGIPGRPTGSLADDLFEELDDAVTDMEQALSEGLRRTDGVERVYSVVLEPDPARLTLRQNGFGVGAKIGEVDGRVSVKARVPGYGWCGTYRVDIEIRNFRVEADYDVWNGRIKNAAIGYSVGRVDVDSNGLLAGACKFFFETFVEGQSTRSFIIEELRKQADSLVMEAEMEELFSLRDLVQEGRQFVTAIDVPDFDFAGLGLPVIAEEARDDAIEALDHVVSVLDEPSFQGTGLNVTLELKPQSTNNILNLIVSHAPADISAFEVDNRCATFNVAFGDRTQYGVLYSRSGGSGYWQREKNIWFPGSNFVGEVDPNDQYIVIAKSSLFGNLYSRPDRDNIATFRPDYGWLPEIYASLCDGEGLPGGGGGPFPNGFPH